MITRWTLRDANNEVVFVADSDEAHVKQAGHTVWVKYNEPFSAVMYWTGEGWTLTANEVTE